MNAKRVVKAMAYRQQQCGPILFNLFWKSQSAQLTRFTPPYAFLTASDRLARITVDEVRNVALNNNKVGPRRFGIIRESHTKR